MKYSKMGKLYMKEKVSEWLKFAEEDLKTAELTLKEGIYNQTCFHSSLFPTSYCGLIKVDIGVGGN